MESPASMPAAYMASISTSNAGLAVTDALEPIRTLMSRRDRGGDAYESLNHCQQTRKYVVLGRDAVVAAVERDHGQGRAERNRYFL